MSANDCDTQPSSGDGCIRRRPRNIEKWDRTVAKVKRTQRKEYTQQERKRASYDPQAHNVERLVSEELKDSFISVKEECTFEKNAPGIEIQKVYTMNQNPDLQCIKEEPGIRKECVDEKEIEFGEVQYSSETNRKQNKQFEECGLQSSVNVKEELIGLRMNESSIGAIDQAMVKCMNDEDIAEEKPTIKEEPLDEKDMEISSSLGTTQSERNQKPLESGAETKVKIKMYSVQQKQKIVQFWYETKSYVGVRRRFVKEFGLRRGRNTPDDKSIWRIIQHFEKEQTIHPCNKGRSGAKPTITQQKRRQIHQSVENSPKKSHRIRAQELGLTPTTLWRTMRKDLQLLPYRISTHHVLKPEDMAKRV